MAGAYKLCMDGKHGVQSFKYVFVCRSTLIGNICDNKFVQDVSKRVAVHQAIDLQIVLSFFVADRGEDDFWAGTQQQV